MKKGVMYDYSGCFYPQGLDPTNVFYFNKESFQEIYDDWMKENKTTIKRELYQERRNKYLSSSITCAKY